MNEKKNAVRWSELTAIFGGAFDPPHLGHREAVESLLRNPGVRRVIILPSGSPPLKEAATPSEHRLAMTKLNFAKLREGLSMRVEIDEREIDRKGPSYTYDTVSELRGSLGSSIAFVIGVDQIEALERWHRIRDLLGLCHWIAIERELPRKAGEDPATRMTTALKRLQALGLVRSTGKTREWETIGGTCLIAVSTDARATSSTEIRGRFARGTSISPQIIGQIGPECLPELEVENLHPDVESYLKAHHLYGT